MSPWVLTALAAVPVLWWMLRVIPPRPKTINFSAFFFLKGLDTNLKSAARTPWWLLLLRSLVVIFFIVAFAEPVLHPTQDLPGGTRGEVLMIVDNGWAAASNWKTREDKFHEYLQKIQRSGRTVVFLPTSPSPTDGRLHSYGPTPAEKGLEWVNRLRPNPWPADYTDAVTLAQKIKNEHPVTHTVFFSDGLAAPSELLELVQALVTDDSTNNPYVLQQTTQNTGQIGFSLERLHTTVQDTPLRLLAYSDEGTVLDDVKINFPADKTEHGFIWDTLPEVRNKTSRLELRDPPMASGVFLVGTQWRQHPVGIVATAEQKESRDFLSEAYYLRRALEGNNQVTIDQLEVLLKLPLSALILPDSTPLTAAEKTTLLAWVRQGGFLIRFAGSNLAAQSEDTLLPVMLRSGQRTMAGAMTWEKPAHLGTIAEQSPLYGLPVPQDVTVTRQLLAEPSPETFEKTWLQLEDGTPLMTGSKIDKGTIVLIHTSAGPDWSNFCYSGLYVESLQRMVSLSNGISDHKVQTTLPPLLLLDGFGRLATPDSQAITASIRPDHEFEPSPLTPPGIYGNSQEFQAFNLGSYLPRLESLKEVPMSITTEPYQQTGETNLKLPLIQAAIILLLAETLVTFWLRGIIAFATVLLAAVIFSTPATAAQEEKDLVSGIYLGYITTSDQTIDRTSFNGLTGLGEEINKRTSAKVKGVSALNPESDQLSYYPLIYWPMTERQDELSVAAARNIQNYLSQGGMIIFDTRDGQFGGSQDSATPGARQLRKLTQRIQIPELIVVPSDHILTRSFYLLDEFPGRYSGGKLWVEKEPSPHHDSVTSVVIGDNDWAAAWSKDAGDQSRYEIEPGGERQREIAYRFGINLVMGALTGSYKADQVHVPYILERIGQ
ncbi:MAG: DUF4159 domain-containing protein [Proteobacteria bacterium]|nr:DUF4159 domain-containing protein [Pseudomonadota bacterium]